MSYIFYKIVKKKYEYSLVVGLDIKLSDNFACNAVI